MKLQKRIGSVEKKLDDDKETAKDLKLRNRIANLEKAVAKHKDAFRDTKLRKRVATLEKKDAQDRKRVAILEKKDAQDQKRINVLQKQLLKIAPSSNLKKRVKALEDAVYKRVAELHEEFRLRGGTGRGAK